MATAVCLILHLLKNIWWNKICKVLLLFVCLGRLKGKSTISSVWKETREIILLCLAQLQVCRSLFEVLPLFPEWICLMCNDVFCIRWLMFDHLAWSFLQVQLLQNKKVLRFSFSDKQSSKFCVSSVKLIEMRRSWVCFWLVFVNSQLLCCEKGSIVEH